MIEVIVSVFGVAAIGGAVWSASIIEGDRKSARKRTFAIKPAVPGRKGRAGQGGIKYDPIGQRGSWDYLASAVDIKLQELGIDLDKELKPQYKVGPRLATICFAPGELYDTNAVRPKHKTSKWEQILRDSRIKINPATARYVEYMSWDHNYAGIEFPHGDFEPVLFEDLLLSKEYKSAGIPLVIGKTSIGDVLIPDLADARNPHWFLGGVTGAGKTVLMRSMICGCLCAPAKKRPLVALIDVAKSGDEFSIFDGHSALCTPVITTAEAAAGFLRWLAEVELQGRYRDRGKRDRSIIVFIDEIAELFQDKDYSAVIEGYCATIARLGRAAKIHLVMATQVLDAEVFPQQLRGNVPGRICLSTATRVQGGQVIQQKGFDSSGLLGNGDLFALVGGEIQRGQSAYIDEEAIADLVQANAGNGEHKYKPTAGMNGDVIIEGGVADTTEHTEFLKYYNGALLVLEKYRLTGISKSIIKDELSITSNSTVDRIMKRLFDENRIGEPGSAPKNRRAVL